jgi:hypothetical protein
MSDGRVANRHCALVAKVGYEIRGYGVLKSAPRSYSTDRLLALTEQGFRVTGRTSARDIWLLTPLGNLQLAARADLRDLTQEAEEFFVPMPGVAGAGHLAGGGLQRARCRGPAARRARGRLARRSENDDAV